MLLLNYALFNLYIFVQHSIYILHAQYIPSTDTYSVLYFFMIYVLVPCIRIVLRSIFCHVLATSMVNAHTSRTIDMLLILVFYTVFCLVRVSWGACPTNSTQLKAFQTQYQNQLELLSLIFQLLLYSQYVLYIKTSWVFPTLNYPLVLLPYSIYHIQLFPVCLIYIRHRVNLGSLVILGPLLRQRDNIGV